MLYDADFANATLHGAIFSDANLRGASFYCAKAIEADFRGANLRLASVDRMEVYDANFTGAEGLWGPERAVDMGTVIGVEHAIFSSKYDLVHWGRLRVITTLHLFTASNVAFFCILAYATAMRWYNTQVPKWHAWGAMHREASEPTTSFLAGLIERIPLLPVQRHFGLLLLALLSLACATSLFTWFCPDPVKEATETRWTRELNQPLIEYRSAMYHAIWIRYATFVLFLLGGGYTVFYTLWRAWEAICYLMRETVGIG